MLLSWNAVRPESNHFATGPPGFSNSARTSAKDLPFARQIPQWSSCRSYARSAGSRNDKVAKSLPTSFLVSSPDFYYAWISSYSQFGGKFQADRKKILYDIRDRCPLIRRPQRRDGDRPNVSVFPGIGEVLVVTTRSSFLHKTNQLANCIATLRVADKMCWMFVVPFPLQVERAIGRKQNTASPATSFRVWRLARVVVKKGAVLDIQIEAFNKLSGIFVNCTESCAVLSRSPNNAAVWPYFPSVS